MVITYLRCQIIDAACLLSSTETLYASELVLSKSTNCSAGLPSLRFAGIYTQRNCIATFCPSSKHVVHTRNSLPESSALFRYCFRPCSSSGLSCASRSLGKVIARSRAYGMPLCLPLIIIAQITSLLKTLKCPHSDVEFVGYPNDKPTLPYAETTSKNIENTENA